MVDAGLGNRWVNNHALTSFESLNKQRLHWNLLNNEWRNVWLETTCSETIDDDPENENTHRRISVGDHWWDGRDDEDNVTDNCDSDGDTNGLVATPVLVSHVRSEEWDGVNPERVEGVDGRGDTWTLSKSTGYTLFGIDTGNSPWFGAWKVTSWKWLIDIVGDYLVSVIASTMGNLNRLTNNLGSVVGEALAKFDECDSEDGKWNWGGNSAKGICAIEFFLSWVPLHELILLAANGMMLVGTAFNVQLSNLGLERSTHSAIVLSDMLLVELLANRLGGLLWVLNERTRVILSVNRHVVAFDLRIGIIEEDRKNS